jgi:hypothetical protein
MPRTDPTFLVRRKTQPPSTPWRALYVAWPESIGYAIQSTAGPAEGPATVLTKANFWRIFTRHEA